MADPHPFLCSRRGGGWRQWAGKYSGAISQSSAAASPPSADSASETVSEGGASVKLAVSDNSAGTGSPGQINLSAQMISGTPQSTPDTIGAWVENVAEDAMWFVNSVIGINVAEAAPAGGGSQMSRAAVQAQAAVNNMSTASSKFITAMIMQDSSFYPNAINPSSMVNPIGLMQVTQAGLTQLQKEYPEFQLITYSQIIDPQIKIEVGTAYLQLMLNKEGGNYASAMQDYGTGHYGAIQAGAEYLSTNGSAATRLGLYNAIHNSILQGNQL